MEDTLERGEGDTGRSRWRRVVRTLRVLIALAVLVMLIPIAGGGLEVAGDHDCYGRSLLDLVDGRDAPFDPGDRGRAFDAPLGPPLRTLAGAEVLLFLHGPLLLALAGMGRIVRPRATRVLVVAALVVHGATVLLCGDALGTGLGGKLLGASMAGVVVYWAAWSAASIGTVEGPRPPAALRRGVVAAGLLGALALPGVLFLALVRYDLGSTVRAVTLLGEAPGPWGHVAVAALFAPAVAAALDVAGLVRRRYAMLAAAIPVVAAALAAANAELAKATWVAVPGAALLGAVGFAEYVGALVIDALGRWVKDDEED